MLFRIRSKLLLYFIILVVMLSAVGVFFYKSSNQLVAEYDDSLQQFLLLNSMSQRVNSMTGNMRAYLLDKEQSYTADYERDKKALLADRKQLKQAMQTNDVLLLNYVNLIDSFLQSGDETVAAFKADDIDAYSQHFNSMVQNAGFLQESTLNLIDHRLTAYQKFYQQLQVQNHNYKLMALSLFTAAFLLSTLLALWISGGITRPITRLSEAAEQIAEGNLAGEDVKVTTHDELKLLTETFNQMRSSIRQLVTEIQEKSELDTLLKELELRSLQNQMNPHFLFNTLNTVSKMAYLEEAMMTSRLIEAVAAILRYNLTSLKQASTLRDEMQIVKEYFFIQKTRFGDRIDFMTEVEEDCLDVEIPSLILQPLVENAIMHGVESLEEGGVIGVYVYRQPGQIVVEVADNGEGMEEEVKEQLQAYIQAAKPDEKPLNAKGNGIGVQNVIRRLQLFYQKQDVVDITSGPGKGTVFKLIIPDEGEGERHAEDFDCG
ncbi:sensor histidine kinase [Ectobacillus ponti]|uniref:histidine kinase n=1 Tax=Ectobacillus ponti TaxID=2961894 RepID=A0AA41X6W1_9BACI|nr:histidine kinase [Ectobacillus ponti]MCP8970034.1 histidine kinase [Ectobacillus ponti]